jgi:hypothetical protein
MAVSYDDWPSRDATVLLEPTIEGFLSSLNGDAFSSVHLWTALHGFNPAAIPQEMKADWSRKRLDLLKPLTMADANARWPERLSHGGIIHGAFSSRVFALFGHTPHGPKLRVRSSGYVEVDVPEDWLSLAFALKNGFRVKVTCHLPTCALDIIALYSKKHGKDLLYRAARARYPFFGADGHGASIVGTVGGPFPDRSVETLIIFMRESVRLDTAAEERAYMNCKTSRWHVGTFISFLRRSDLGSQYFASLVRSGSLVPFVDGSASAARAAKSLLANEGAQFIPETCFAFGKSARTLITTTSHSVSSSSDHAARAIVADIAGRFMYGPPNVVITIRGSFSQSAEAVRSLLPVEGTPWDTVFEDWGLTEQDFPGGVFNKDTTERFIGNAKTACSARLTRSSRKAVYNAPARYGLELDVYDANNPLPVPLGVNASTSRALAALTDKHYRSQGATPVSKAVLGSVLYLSFMLQRAPLLIVVEGTEEFSSFEDAMRHTTRFPGVSGALMLKASKLSFDYPFESIPKFAIRLHPNVEVALPFLEATLPYLV